VLEITEDVMVEHLDGLTVLRQIRDLGVSLAIDDFGTGQSSLSYIRQFDMASTLKIDQSFVRQMHAGTADQAIVEAIVTMASALDMKIVAEGVEDHADVNRLLDLGVGLMQGFLFDRPASADAIGDLGVLLASEQQTRPALAGDLEAVPGARRPPIAGRNRRASDAVQNSDHSSSALP
jgi:EAL domain-containing protein (putative c-di-GMP-specific phosphodiesterase class I)